MGFESYEHCTTRQLGGDKTDEGNVWVGIRYNGQGKKRLRHREAFVGGRSPQTNDK